MRSGKPPHEDKDKKKDPSRTVGTDFRRLPNEELHRLLCAIDPEMSSFPVTDDTRETVIAMLEIVSKG